MLADSVRRATINMALTLSAQIESILLFRGGAVLVSELASATQSSDEAVHEAIGDLEALYEGRGMRVVVGSGRVALTTAEESAALIETLRREELDGPLGRAGLETLAVIMYRGPVARADIEYIRGVNVSSALRSLMIRGLITRVDNPNDARAFLYQTTPEVPAYFGVTRIEDIPDFAQIRAELERIMTEKPLAAPEEATPA
jgi:segregation and condensation protein B